MTAPSSPPSSPPSASPQVDPQLRAQLVQGLKDSGLQAPGGLVSGKGATQLQELAELARALPVDAQRVPQFLDRWTAGLEQLLQVRCQAHVPPIEILDDGVDGAVAGRVGSRVETVRQAVLIPLSRARGSAPPTVASVARWVAALQGPLLAPRPPDGPGPAGRTILAQSGTAAPDRPASLGVGWGAGSHRSSRAPAVHGRIPPGQPIVKKADLRYYLGKTWRSGEASASPPRQSSSPWFQHATKPHKPGPSAVPGRMEEIVFRALIQILDMSAEVSRRTIKRQSLIPQHPRCQPALALAPVAEVDAHQQLPALIVIGHLAVQQLVTQDVVHRVKRQPQQIPMERKRPL